MFYRDFMQRFRPLYSPDEPAAPAAGADVVVAAAPAVEAAPAAAEAVAAPAAEAAPAPAAAEAPKGEPSLLEAATGTKPETAAADAPAADKDSPAPAEAATDAKPEGDKPKAEDDKSKAEGDKPKDGDDKSAAETDPANKDATAAEPPAPIKYEAFKLPEGLKLDDERIGKFTEIAGVAQVPQDVAQQFMDLHVAEMQRFSQDVVKQAEQHQRDVWRKLNDTWKTEMRNDPEIGGNRLETSLSRAKAVIEEYLGPENGGSAEMVQDMIAHTTANGMGNFPPFVRLMNKIGEVLNIFEDSPVTANPTSPKPAKGPGQRGWYPSMNGGQPPQS